MQRQELRITAAIETGNYFDRCLRGVARGASGRRLIDLPCNVYVVVQDFSGLQHSPVLVYQRYSVALQLITNPRDRQDFGTSVFAGFNSEWEARIAVSQAGLVWPTWTD